MADQAWVPATGDRVVMEGVIADARDGFALVTVEGSQPPGTYISVAYPALLLAEPPATQLLQPDL